MADATSDEVATNKALSTLKLLQRQVHPIPKLEDYYSPGPDQKGYETMVVGALGLLRGLGVAGVASTLM